MPLKNYSKNIITTYRVFCKNKMMVRFGEVQDEKGLFTFYKEQGQQQTTSTKQTIDVHRLQKTVGHGRKQIQQKDNFQNKNNKEVHVYKFLANCVSHKRKYTLPIISSVDNSDIVDHNDVLRLSETNSYSEDPSKIQGNCDITEQPRKEIAKKIMTQQGRGHCKKNTKVSYQQIQLKALKNPYLCMQKKSKNKLQGFEKNKKILGLKQNILIQKPNNSEIKTKKKPSKQMLDYENKQNSCIRNIQYMQNLKKQKPQKSKKHKKVKQIDLSINNNKIYRQNSLRLHLNQAQSTNINPINSFDERFSLQKVNKSLHLKLPQLAMKIPTKMKKKPLLLTDKTRNKFPQCLIGNLYLNGIQEDGKVKKLRQGNSVVMMQHIKDEIMDGWEKRKIEFLKQLIIKNSKSSQINMNQQ